MASPVKVLFNHYKRYLRDKFDKSGTYYGIKIIIDENDNCSVIAKISATITKSGDYEFELVDTPPTEHHNKYYVEYYMQLSVNGNYPFTPPVFKMLNNNGLFMVGSFPCVSIGHYHSDAYNPTLGVIGFITSVSTMFMTPNNLYGISISGGDKITNIREAAKSNQFDNININQQFSKHDDLLIELSSYYPENYNSMKVTEKNRVFENAIKSLYK
jgi:ubiquitin-protein ligase